MEISMFTHHIAGPCRNLKNTNDLKPLSDVIHTTFPDILYVDRSETTATATGAAEIIKVLLNTIHFGLNLHVNCGC